VVGESVEPGNTEVSESGVAFEARADRLEGERWEPSDETAEALGVTVVDRVLALYLMF
jgi:hypothetical protein